MHLCIHVESGRQEMVEGGHLLDGTGKTNKLNSRTSKRYAFDHVSMEMPYCLLQIE